MKVSEAMKAKSAATIFDPMALDLLLPIVRQMRETKVAAIVAEMDPAKARALTADLARSPAPTPPATAASLRPPAAADAHACGARAGGTARPRRKSGADRTPPP